MNRAAGCCFLAAHTTALLAARDPDRAGAIVGTVTLVVYRYRTPICLRARVEDLVVDREVRGRRIGRALLEAAIDLATSTGAEQVDLQCSPEDEVANRLYRSAGFELYSRNVYRYRLQLK